MSENARDAGAVVPGQRRGLLDEVALVEQLLPADGDPHPPTAPPSRDASSGRASADGAAIGDGVETDDLPQTVPGQPVDAAPVVAWPDIGPEPVLPPGPVGAAPPRRVWRRHAARFGVAGASLAAILFSAYVILADLRVPAGPAPLPLPISGGPLVGMGPAGPNVTIGAASGGPGVRTTAGAGSPPATPGAVAVPGASPGAPTATASADPTTTPQPTATPAPVTLRARYSTVAHIGLLGLTGYRGQVSITNPGPVAVAGWQVIISLPAGLSASRVAGAAYQQSGRLIVFDPIDATHTVPAGGSVAFTFEVAGLLAGAPTGCAINTNPCA